MFPIHVNLIFCTVFKDTSAHEDSQAHRINSCKTKKKKKKKEKEKNNTRRDKNVSRTIKANGKFADTNPGIKKNHYLIKTVTAI